MEEGVGTAGLRISTLPNPASDQIELRLEGFDETPVSVQLITPLGQRMLQRSVETTGGLLDLHHLPSGVYLLHAEQGQRRAVTRLILQH